MAKPNQFGNYKRLLTLDKIKLRFQLHQKLHDFEVDQLFEDIKHKPFTPIQYRYLEKGIRYQGVIDIETSDFNPYKNFIIGYVMIIRDIVTGKEQLIADNIEKKDIALAVKNDSFDFDKRLLEDLGENMARCDHLVGHYSSKFDIPYIRSRLLLTNQEQHIPDYGQIRFGDTWRMMKNSIKAPRNTLKNLAIYTNTKDQKTHVDYGHWQRIWFKDSPLWDRSMHYIMDHCIKDVKMTVRALKKIETFNNIPMAMV
jgi:hypothetical protein